MSNRWQPILIRPSPRRTEGFWPSSAWRICSKRLLARARLPEGLLDLQDFAVKARYSPAATPLPAPREQILAQIHQLRAELEEQLGALHGLLSPND
jgi:hypothetical protein